MYLRPSTPFFCFRPFLFAAICTANYCESIHSTNDIDPNKVSRSLIDFKNELLTPGTFLFA